MWRSIKEEEDAHHDGRRSQVLLARVGHRHRDVEVQAVLVLEPILRIRFGRNLHLKKKNQGHK
jgi:hypothetical protein